MINHKGSSILMALGTIAILLIIVVGLASVYIREFKLSRTSYNDIIASAGAEGAFEYGMLKIRNHREGFADTMNTADVDSKLLRLSSLRSKGVESVYTITANSKDNAFTVAPNEHLIVPLFASNESLISPTGTSRNPKYNTGVTKTQNLAIQGMGNLSWIIIAMNGTNNVGLSGSGDVSPAKSGLIRHKTTQCYNTSGDSIACSNTFSVAEEIPYFWDESISVGDFLTQMTDSYLMIYNSETTPVNIRITASTPFALPQMTIEATAQKNDSSQIFRFTEDKSRYYDALKYGVYNN